MDYSKNFIVSPSDTRHPRQFHIMRENFDGPNWEDAYIEFSGFFGDIGPHVFAAAPELLEALERTLNFIANTESEMGEQLECGDMARAAIAKARGQS